MSSISKKPKPTSALSAKAVNDLIQKGGEEQKKKSDNLIEKTTTDKVPIQLRLPQELVEVIDGLIDERVVTITRHAWFLEAIAGKIKKEKEG